MDELLLAVLEALLEFFLEMAGELLLDLLTRAGVAIFKSEPPVHRVGTLFACFFYGLLAGAVSLSVLRHPVFHPSRVHGVSLIVSPVLTGTVMSGIGTLLRRCGKQIIQIESFPYAFAFALGMALIRFLFVS